MDVPTDPVARIAAAVLPHRDAFIAELVEATEKEIAVLDHDERLHSLLHASITENVVAGLHVLSNGIDPRTVDAPPSAISYARHLAQRDVPMSALLRAYRLGASAFLHRALSETANLPGQNGTSVVISLMDISAAYIDRVSEQVARAYEEERERWVSSRGVLRQHWVTQLLQDPSPNLTQAEAALGYRLAGTHLAVEGWMDRSSDPYDAMTILERLSTVLRRVFKAREHPLVVPTDETDVRFWFPVKAGLTVDAETVALELVRARLPVRLAIGNPRPGLDGFRRSIRGASRAKTLALAAGDDAPPVVSFAEVAPVALLADEPGELADFVADTLGSLVIDDPWRQSLRETLRIFLATHRSYAATAELLTVHRNTVHYRIQQTVEKYGVPLEGNTFELQLALAICRWHGSTVLRRASG
ncbi:helix-turn-helix domain-containing protein [Streptomyces sp. NA02950]|uniref:PucR family transcriptional regulator n=1 Tax=Streptomyces sp. NA02950 TaxID=2742137 RepID=UPI0015921C57|nr:helix-turn-helix domain-containing protein [Streptomyces sp. NA02950]QKV90644.1 helix-turn-helix domain-containing protein [Streptomyces sp. NA02950]